MDKRQNTKDSFRTAQIKNPPEAGIEDKRTALIAHNARANCPKVEGFDCDTRALPLLISRRSVLVLAASNCGSADLRVFASAGAADHLITSQIEKATLRWPSVTVKFYYG